MFVSYAYNWQVLVFVYASWVWCIVCLRLHIFGAFLADILLTCARCDGSALINDVLDLSKIEAGRMELESVAFNIRREVDNVFHLFDETVQQKKIEMSMLVHDTVPTCIVGDPGRFRQVPVFLLLRSLTSVIEFIIDFELWGFSEMTEFEE